MNAYEIEEEIKKKKREIEELEKELASTSLEDEFQSLLKRYSLKIADHLQKAHEQISHAVELSEETGVPFSFGVPVGGDADRLYFPKKFKRFYDNLDCDFFDECGVSIWVQFPVFGEWEHWNTSSLRC